MTEPTDASGPGAPAPDALDWSAFPAFLSPPPVDWQIAHGSRDVYYRRAKETGYRARSAYKLIQVDDTYHIFDGVTSVVDLCAAPGSWSQVAASRVNHTVTRTHNGTDTEVNAGAGTDSASVSGNRVLAIDLQEMSPIPGVDCLQGDITSQATCDTILRHFPNRVDLVICDGAPDVTGMHEIDEFVHSQLLHAALMLTIRMLRDRGTFVAKIFKSSQWPVLESQLLIYFDRVDCMKPSSSRMRSAEHFVVCQGFKLPAGYTLRPLGQHANDDCNNDNDISNNEAMKCHSEPYRSMTSRDFTALIDHFVEFGDYSQYDTIASTAASSPSAVEGTYASMIRSILGDSNTSSASV